MSSTLGWANITSHQFKQRMLTAILKLKEVGWLHITQVVEKLLAHHKIFDVTETYQVAVAGIASDKLLVISSLLYRFY